MRRSLMRKLKLRNDYGFTSLGAFLMSISVVVFLFLLIMVPAYFLDRQVCADKAEAMERESRYGLFTGCMVETDNGYFPLDQVRENQ